MFFFTLALPKCNQKQKQKHTATHTLTLVSKIMKMLFKWLQSELPWTPETFHCSHFCDFDASLFRFFRGQKNIDFGALWAGAGGGGRGSSKLQILQILTKDLARPAPPSGVRRMKGFAPCRRPPNSGFDDGTIR